MTNSVQDPPAPSPAALELLAALRKTEQARRELYAEQLRILTDMDLAGVPEELGHGGVASIAREVLRINTTDARKRVQHARALLPGLSPTGAELQPDLPKVAAAAAAGVIGPEHIDVIRDTVARLPRPVHLAQRESTEAILLTASADLEPATVAGLGREILARLDQDGTPPDDEKHLNPDRSFDYTHYRDGRVAGKFSLDAEIGALLAALMEPLAARTPEAADGPDTRGKHQRQADAFADILRLAATTTTDPGDAAEPVTILATIPLERLEEATKHGLLDGGIALSAAQIRRMACDAAAIPAVLGSQGQVLDLGRRTRIVSRALRRALIARDGGCVFRGCHRKPRHCEAHHVVHWANGGITALSNLVLLCRRHHKVIHHSEWQVIINAAGIPETIPPAWLDPHQKPRRNPLHQPC